VGALLIFAAGGAWGYQQMQEQKARDDMRTARLIACLDAAHDAVDGSAARTACRHKYADRVPALLRNDPYAFDAPRTTASATPVPDAMSAADAPTWGPKLSSPDTADAAKLADPAPSEGVSEEPAAGGNEAAAQAAHPPVANGKTEKPPSAKNNPAADRPKGNKGKHVGAGETSAKPGTKKPASSATAPPGNRNSAR
jgi:hypothetical protein